MSTLSQFDKKRIKSRNWTREETSLYVEILTDPRYNFIQCLEEKSIKREANGDLYKDVSRIFYSRLREKNFVERNEKNFVKGCYDFLSIDTKKLQAKYNAIKRKWRIIKGLARNDGTVNMDDRPKWFTDIDKILSNVICKVENDYDESSYDYSSYDEQIDISRDPHDSREYEREFLNYDVSIHRDDHGRQSPSKGGDSPDKRENSPERAPTTSASMIHEYADHTLKDDFVNDDVISDDGNSVPVEGTSFLDNGIAKPHKIRRNRSLDEIKTLASSENAENRRTPDDICRNAGRKRKFVNGNKTANYFEHLLSREHLGNIAPINRNPMERPLTERSFTAGPLTERSPAALSSARIDNRVPYETPNGEKHSNEREGTWQVNDVYCLCAHAFNRLSESIDKLAQSHVELHKQRLDYEKEQNQMLLKFKQDEAEKNREHQLQLSKLFLEVLKSKKPEESS